MSEREQRPMIGTSHRRQFLVSAAATAACVSTPAVSALAANGWRMPDEAERHRRTWMAYAHSARIWGSDLLPDVRQNQKSIANTIARFEPVTMLAHPRDVKHARAGLSRRVTVVPAPLDDLWMRDTGPVFVKGPGGKRAGIDFNFNGWGNKQRHANDAKIAAKVCNLAGAQRIRSSLVMEGGGIEVDGKGTALLTESCILNRNRNPGVSKAACEAELKRTLGINKAIWLPGVAGADITDGHIDFYARFVRPGVVVAALENDPELADYKLTREHLKLLRAATDAQGRRLKVVTLTAPRRLRYRYADDDFAAGYINYYVCNGAVIAPHFGDRKADAAARRRLTALYPGRRIVLLNIDAVAAGGGGIHCTTQQEPA